MYRVVLQKSEPDRALYLAIPKSLRKYLLSESDYRDILRDLKVRIIFYDTEGKEQTEWINPASLAP
jgi:hypothetical protein